MEADSSSFASSGAAEDRRGMPAAVLQAMAGRPAPVIELDVGPIQNKLLRLGAILHGDGFIAANLQPIPAATRTPAIVGSGCGCCVGFSQLLYHLCTSCLGPPHRSFSGPRWGLVYLDGFQECPG